MTALHAHPYDSVLDPIGWTPLVRLNKITAGVRTRVHGTSELFNPDVLYHVAGIR